MTARTSRRSGPTSNPLIYACVAAAMCLVGATTVAQTPSTAASAVQPASAPQPKDVVLDGPAASASTAAGARASAAASAPAPDGRAPRLNSAVHDAATAGALAELALDLMRQHSQASGNAQHNAVVSPLSLSAALGMAHAGAGGSTARELALLMGSGSSGERLFSRRLPALLDRLSLSPSSTAGARQDPLAMANRVWLGQNVVTSIPPSYAALVVDRFHADAGVVPFDNPDAARTAINGWVSQQTAQRIPELMPAGSITPNTRVVLTNATHFKSPWARPFDPAATVARPFQVQGGPARMVPTMVDQRQVLTGVVDNITVYELPFAGEAYSLVLGMAPPGHTLNGFETDLAGLDLAAWSSALKSTTCRFEMPKFSIAATSRPLKQALQQLGVQAAFSDAADFGPLLGKAAKGVHLDNVFQSATIDIDETGGEAAAATGAAVIAKSFSPPDKVCAVNRPFIFAVLHKASGAPVFVGKLADPAAK
jgi:serpin B